MLEATKINSYVILTVFSQFNIKYQPDWIRLRQQSLLTLTSEYLKRWNPHYNLLQKRIVSQDHRHHSQDRCHSPNAHHSPNAPPYYLTRQRMTSNHHITSWNYNYKKHKIRSTASKEKLRTIDSSWLSRGKKLKKINENWCSMKSDVANCNKKSTPNQQVLLFSVQKQSESNRFRPLLVGGLGWIH